MRCNSHTIQLTYLKYTIQALASVAQWVGASSCKLKGRRFDSQAGYLPGLRIWSQIKEHVRGNRMKFLCHMDVSLPLSLSPFLSLSLKSISMSSSEDKNKYIRYLKDIIYLIF